jgi:hypothetical protein
MATNSYVTLNGKRYAVAQTRYEPRQEKFQRVHVTVGGVHVAQQFNFTEYRWGFDLRVPYTGDATYGSLDDLKTAYALLYCSLTDHYGTVYDVFFEGPLQERPDGPIIDGAAVFTVPINLRRKQ